MITAILAGISASLLATSTIMSAVNSATYNAENEVKQLLAISQQIAMLEAQMKQEQANTAHVNNLAKQGGSEKSAGTQELMEQEKQQLQEKAAIV